MRCGVAAAFPVVGFYTVYILNCLPTFRVTQSGSSVHEECLTLDDWTGRLSRSVGKKTTKIAV
jgi:hypothetical protein